jgi:hemin uptake protein HemP
MRGRGVNDGSGDRDRGAAAAQPKPRITSAELLRGARELVIQHGADEYRLRLTSKLKLILTK